MSQLMKSKKQKMLFEDLSQEDCLIFASGAPGISANLVGHFKVRQYNDGKEDRLDLEEGTNHVHIDWSNVKSCEIGNFNGEGMLTFFNGDKILFKLYKPSGKFSDSVISKAGSLE